MVGSIEHSHRWSPLGHFRPIRQILPASSDSLRPESGPGRISRPVRARVRARHGVLFDLGHPPGFGFAEHGEALVSQTKPDNLPAITQDGENASVRRYADPEFHVEDDSMLMLVNPVTLPPGRASDATILRPVRGEIPLCKALRPRSRFAGAGPQPSRYLPLRIGAGLNSIHRLLGKGLGLLFGRTLVFRKSHPFADKLSARLMLGLHIKKFEAKR